ncbi:CysZ protein [Pseudoalteromonas sp. BSi20495]|nr:CysZ protein [Pseudoalteromonas sp. BSi20495]
MLPQWLSWLEWLMWPIAILMVLFSYSMLFTVITNFIAAPFNALLSEKVELYLTGQKINDDGFAELVKDIPRMLAREWTKLCYYLPRAIGFLYCFGYSPSLVKYYGSYLPVGCSQCNTKTMRSITIKLGLNR